jgi:hypothetical protein
MRNDSPETSTDIRRTLGLDEPADGRRRLLPWVLAAVLLALAGLGVAYFTSDDNGAVRFRTAEAQTGRLTVIVSATGQLKPVNQVDVGTEVSAPSRTSPSVQRPGSAPGRCWPGWIRPSRGRPCVMAALASAPSR